jgi:hypothetical protein
LFEHWLHCYDLFEQDKKYLTHLYELAYEDYIVDPARHHREIALFIGTRIPEGGMEEVAGAHNQKYFDRWCNLLRSSLFKSYYRHIARKYEPRFAKYGYSLTKGLGMSDEVLQGGGKGSGVLGALYCLGADAGVFLLRFGLRTRWRLKRAIKALLPEFVLTRVRQARQRASLSKRKTRVVSQGRCVH